MSERTLFLGLGVMLALAVSGCASAVAPGEISADEPDAQFDELDDTTIPDAVGDRAWPGDDEPEDGLWSHTDPGELPSVRDGSGALLPLIHTDVSANLRGHFGDVGVRQTFRNDAEDVIEVVYTFPLPENAAVSSMRMIVGERVIESDVMRRDAARQTYEEARKTGHTAALLEQERPNVFTQSLANIPPGEDIDVEIHYVQTLSYDAGEYEFVFPMVIGPRYVSGEGTGEPAAGSGDTRDTKRVPDASRISPPIVGSGMRRGDDLDLEVRAETGYAIDKWRVPTHEVEHDVAGTRLTVRLPEADERPNRDFVMRYKAAGADPRATMFLGPPDRQGDGHFALVVQPPDVDVDALVGRREFIFVVDRSGSMSGIPLALAKDVVRQSLMHLRPVDTFEIVGFESGTTRLFGTPRAANAGNLAEALGFIDGMVSGGGTEMGSAVEAALQNDVARGRHRYVMFLTDGNIGFEAEIQSAARRLVAAIGSRGQQARVFAVGIGSSPNRGLIAGLARAGRGAPLYTNMRGHTERVVGKFARYVDHPIVDALAIDSGSMKLDGQHPADLGGLFASHATVAMGRYRGAATRPPVVVGAAEGKSVRIPVTVVDSTETDAVMGALWAKAAVTDLESELWLEPGGDARDRITELGLEHHIVTPFTSLVAVDRSRVVGDGDPRLVVEPTNAPEDMSLEGGMLDSAGITLAGTTGAESRYTVDGANVNNPSFGKVSYSASAARAISESGYGSGGGSWEPRARMVIGKFEAASKSATRRIKRAVRAVRGDVAYCYEGSSGYESGVSFTVSVVVRWEADGSISVALDVDDGRLTKTAASCMRAQLVGA
ncbi:MAG: VIT and VWA domain-containing protein, partial [Myxococcota bacterium]